MSESKQTKEYRTRDKAGVVAMIPKDYAIITQPRYQYAMGLFQDKNAHLQPLESTLNVECSNGKIFIKGIQASEAEIKNYFTNDVPDNIDLPLLRVFYNIVLYNTLAKIKANEPASPVFTVYLPDFFAYYGERNINRSQTLALINQIMSYHSIVGIIDGNILPVLLFTGENKKTNTISFMSPYMSRVIENVYSASIRYRRNGTAILKRNNEPQTYPSYSYLIKPTIKSERNKRAVEIVHIVITLIEQAGNNIPHISAQTIVDRNILLKNAMAKASPADKNKLLKRAFTKAWNLLRSQTNLEEVYPGIQLPDSSNPINIPTMSKLQDTVFIFNHNGKKTHK